MSKENYTVKVTGKCDAGCGKNAEFWYNNTGAATCGETVCIEVMDQKYKEHCEHMEWVRKLEQEMEEFYGEWYE